MLDVSPFFFEQGPTGCLLIHGFTGSPPEMRPMGEFLAQKGITVLGVCLAGHGTTAAEMARTDYRDWIASSEAGLAQLQKRCRRIFVAGLSMGGLLAFHLAAAHRPAGVISMGTPARIADWRFYLVPLAQYFTRWIYHNGETDYTDPQGPERTFCYDKTPTVCLVSLGKLLREVRRELPRIDVPCLIMQGEQDRIIHRRSADIIYRTLGAGQKQIVRWPNSGHCITIDSERQAVWEKAYVFMRETPDAP